MRPGFIVSAHTESWVDEAGGVDWSFRLALVYTPGARLVIVLALGTRTGIVTDVYRRPCRSMAQTG